MIYILLPAYNESKDIGALLSSIGNRLNNKQLPYMVLVVDDGSTDGTESVVKAFTDNVPLQLIKHEKNKGLGEAIKTGLNYVVTHAQNEDVLVIMDADNTHPPELIPGMFENIKKGSDLVIASRYRKGAKLYGVPYYRQLLSIGASWLFRIFLPIKGVRDYTGGYRAYRISILKKAFAHYNGNFVTEQGFSCMIDILFKLKVLKPIITEVPIPLYYSNKKGTSKMQIGKSIKNTLKLFYSQIRSS